MGKTALGLNIAEHLAIVENRPVLFFSLEMSRQQVAQRVLCSQARVNAHQLRRQRRSAADLRLLEDFAQRLEAAPLYVDDTSDLSILEMRARARMAYRKHKIRAVFVDYLQLMHRSGSESRQVEVATIPRGAWRSPRTSTYRSSRWLSSTVIRRTRLARATARA